MLERTPRTVTARKRRKDVYSSIAKGLQRVRFTDSWRVKLPRAFGEQTHATFGNLEAAKAFQHALSSLLSVEQVRGRSNVASLASTVDQTDDADFADFIQALCTGEVEVDLPIVRVSTPVEAVEAAEPTEPPTPPTPTSVAKSRVRPKPLAANDPLLCRETLLCKSCAAWPARQAAPTKRRLFRLPHQLFTPVKAAPLRGPIRSMWGDSLRLF